MRIVACLAWYMEPPAFLERCITSLRGLADEAICYDGAWDLWPDGRPESSPEEHAAIARAADEIGLPVTIYTPDTTWASQVEKRASLMLEAGETGADWLLVIDGDEYIASHQASAARALLESTSCDVATIMHKRTTGVEAVNTPGPIRRLYRADTGVTVDTAHNGYRTIDGRWLHGDCAAVKLEPPLDLSRYVLLHHERANRGDARNRAALDYRSARLAQGVESWRR
jgi:hypothetical protein